MSKMTEKRAERKEIRESIPKKEKPKKRKKYVFGAFARWLVSLIFPHKYKIKYSHDPNLKGLKPPYFLLGNHTSFLDPFLMSVGNRHHVNYVANDEYFRYRSLAFLMKMLGAVPKTKFMTDSETVRRIFRLKENGDVIGIYPEGGRTWPGLTQPLLFSTAKLIKRLKIPVVCALTKGGSLSFPRWARKYRKVRIFIHYFLLLAPEQIETMTAEEIHRALTAALAHDEIAWNREAKIRFNGKKLAEHLEWYIYACPRCGRLETLRSKNDLYTCEACGYSVRYTEYGLFESANGVGKSGNDGLPKGQNGGAPVYDNVTDWSFAQYAILKQNLAALTGGEVLLRRDNVTLFQGQRRERVLGSVLRGTLLFTKDGFSLDGGGETKLFPFDKVRGLQINYKNVIDFYLGDEKLRLEFDDKEACGYIWEDAMKALKELKAESPDSDISN
ncbi:MAG: 1-acyl-sn-glycerol-3-phosphate acyltransferase [Clostridiales bacterium]|jgi:1-acyl-sn-glycerol-3-phosphate acyltransferase|nr:1-acyl-sn-glycerol-3-phosphate acyltransferase [Clostridiales bacterium]